MRVIVSALVSLLFIVATGVASAQDAGLSHPDYRTLHELGTKVHADVNKAVDAFASGQEKPSAALLADYEALLKRAEQVADAIGRTDQSLVGRIRRGLVTQGGEGLAEARQGLAENDNDKIRRGLNRMSNAWSVPLARLAPK